MALGASRSLAEIRLDVAIGLGMEQQIKNSVETHSLLDLKIRIAFDFLVREASWVVLSVTRKIDTISEQHAYELPDNIEVGAIEEISALDIEGREYRLNPGVAYYERNIYTNRDASSESEFASLPRRWEVKDGKLMVYPAPDAELYPQLQVRGQITPAPPRKDGDLVHIDSQAIILQATALLKAHFNMPGAQTEEVQLARHLRNLQEAQSDGEVVQIGPTRSGRYGSEMNRVGTRDRARFYPTYDPFFDEGS